MLRQTDSGIYYIHDYIPTRYFNFHSDEENKISKEIWAYKDGNYDEYTKYTNELMHAITEITARWAGKKIGLVAVPPSKVGKKSSISNSIYAMHCWYVDGVTKEHFKCYKTIYDWRTLLTRVKDVSTGHLGQKATYEEHLESIKCSRSRLSRYNTAFIILDDVTTTETSMNVCRDILLAHGAKEQYIKRLAIARTVKE